MLSKNPFMDRVCFRHAFTHSPVCLNQRISHTMSVSSPLFWQTGHWMESRPKNGSWTDSWATIGMPVGAQKWGRFFGHKITDRKWSQTVCDQILSGNFGSIKWPQNELPKIIFLNGSMSTYLLKAFRRQE